MTNSATLTNDPILNSKMNVNEALIENPRDVFMNDFQEFAIEDDMELFNLDLISDIDPLLN